MPLHDLIVVFLISLLIILLPSIGLYKMFEKAGIPAWKAFVPFLNTWEMLKRTHYKKHWFFWQFIPVAGWFISLWILVEFVKLFGKFGFLQHLAVVLAGVIYFPYLGFSSKVKYLGADAVKAHKKSRVREWVDAGVFAVVAATLIRTFVFEAYVIPTGSMEKTLLVSDFLFVSKFSYGPRIPNTPLSFPFVHNYLPITNTKSYLEWIKLPYTRWFASPVKRNDIVVFNFPEGDTVIHLPDFESAKPYYEIKQKAALGSREDQAILDDPENYPVVVHPVDKTDNYIKRCVGISGDTIQIKKGILYVNNAPAYVSPTSATDYTLITKNAPADPDEFADALREEGIRINYDKSSPDLYQLGDNTYRINLTLHELEVLKKMPVVASVTRNIDSVSSIFLFPRNPAVAQWSVDNYGPLWIPKKGATIPLNKENIAFYRRAIEVYEHNQWEERDGKIYLNGQLATTYTFKMDYFWMMGDNRHNSQDSRYWGFVPEDHIVGSAALIWMSTEKGIRWNRLFKTIK